MNKLKIPPHLHVAIGVTEEEYTKSKFQHNVVLYTSMLLGIVAAFPLIYLLGIWIGLALTGLFAVLVDRALNSHFKEARKFKTNRLSKYLALRTYLENNKEASSE
jgi:hypothetical protein